jgi:PH (Pleckstrin Homology) domain-containing protein
MRLFALKLKENKIMDAVRVDTFGLRINQDVCFTTQNNKPHRSTTSRQLKVLRELAPTLKQVLKPDEEILLAVRASSPMSWLEQLVTGWIIYYLKRCVLVFTNKRILHLPTKMNFKPKASIAQILYGDIAEAKTSGSLGRALKLKYKTGKKEDFNYVESLEFKRLKALLPTLPKDGQPSEVSERHHLCPRCQAKLLTGKFTCPSCRLQFKDGERAIKLSILYPGGGYFYTRHPLLGVGDAIVEGILLVFVIAGVIDALSGEGGADPWISVFLLGAALIIEKAQTIYHAKHYVNEYIPEDESFVPLTAPA